MDGQNEEHRQFVQEQLAAPMAAQWRLKSVYPKAQKPYPPNTRGQFLAYIDARDVFNRLDQVVGMGNWRSSIKAVNADGSVIAVLGVLIDGVWVEHEDVGYSNNPGEGVEAEPLKAAASDGIKRAAVRFGIGRFLYDLEPKWVNVDEQGKPQANLNTGEIASHGDMRADGRGNGHSSAPQAAGASPVNMGGQAERLPAEPCAIDQCAGVCQGDWVQFSVRRYGVPLCSKHSALAKRGELDEQLAALNER